MAGSDGSTLPTEDTAVLYPAGATATDATVLVCRQVDADRFAVVLDRTACHPLDVFWPDQPADTAWLLAGEGRVPVVDALVGATDGQSLHIGEAVPVRRGTPGWSFVVAHLTDTPLEEGAAVRVEVDARRRRALSAGHSGCHLASFALNRALASLWKKEESRSDSLGAPNFDQIAVQDSRIDESASTDRYRLGKSLRKRGFDVAGLVEDPSRIESEVNSTLARWTAEAAPMTIQAEGSLFSDLRTWKCRLAEGVAEVSCGGTHVPDTADLPSLRVRLSVEQEPGGVQLTMRTTSRPA